MKKIFSAIIILAIIVAGSIFALKKINDNKLIQEKIKIQAIYNSKILDLSNISSCKNLNKEENDILEVAKNTNNVKQISLAWVRINFKRYRICDALVSTVTQDDLRAIASDKKLQYMVSMKKFKQFNNNEMSDQEFQDAMKLGFNDVTAMFLGKNPNDPEFIKNYSYLAMDQAIK